jgi:tRNA-modifying protein YgfZ
MAAPVLLQDRGAVRVTGEGAKPFLDGLVTCDLDRVAPGRPRFGALLSAQGKILFDFILHQAPPEDDGGYVLEMPAAFAGDLVKRLTLYKLRAKVGIADISEQCAVLAGWGDAPRPEESEGLVAEDPRWPALGWRAIVARPPASGEDESAAYHAHRIAQGVPELGKDALLGSVFPHEMLMDQLGGVDFDKGCYIGQEVVSRMQHRGTARSRMVPLVYRDGFAVEAGAEVTAGGRSIGTAGSGSGGRGLALIRLDRAAEALAAGEPILAGGLPAPIERPPFARFEVPMPGAAA